MKAIMVHEIDHRWDEVRQKILLALIKAGGMGGIHLKILPDAGIICIRRVGTKNYYYIDLNGSTLKPVILFWQQVEPMLKRCIKERERRL